MIMINKILVEKKGGIQTFIYVTSEGGQIIYDAYVKLMGSDKSIIDLELDGYLIGMSLLKRLIDLDFMPKGFTLGKYQITPKNLDVHNKYSEQMRRIKNNNPYLTGGKKAVSDSELAILARKMIKRMNAKQKDIAVKIGVATPTLSRMLNCQTPINKYYSKIELLFNTWRANKINSLRSEIAALKKFRT